ncbi:response regulator [Shinella sp. CPCC 101442]|uniref:response regulator n=1 Tax=Shinella sp. CPCC 101442 TaxID=2932265 RepID=UPI002153287B|nr:response regulator [Shinella sp. CPCC 101442]MCR6502780.1 response regulator [Shinella sp. CPCC 101442]
MSQRTVLVVDDEPLIRMVLADALEHEDFLVIEASSVLEAVAVLGNRHVDCLVTDVDMPGGLSGLDLIRFVRGFDNSMFVIVTSGRVPNEGELPPNERFLQKPYSLETVVAEVNAAIRVPCALTA